MNVYGLHIEYDRAKTAPILYAITSKNYDDVLAIVHSKRFNINQTYLSVMYLKDSESNYRATNICYFSPLLQAAISFFEICNVGFLDVVSNKRSLAKTEYRILVFLLRNGAKLMEGELTHKVFKFLLQFPEILFLILLKNNIPKYEVERRLEVDTLNLFFKWDMYCLMYCLHLQNFIFLL